MTSNASVQAVFGSGTYSDPNAINSRWVVMAGANAAGFYVGNQSSRTISYPSGATISKQCTVVQANNLLIIMPGTGQAPFYWDGDWGASFQYFTNATPPAVNIAQSNQATYYVNRLWVVASKDTVAASDLLSFGSYDIVYRSFNLNIGTSDYVVCTYPFGNNALLVFKNQSIQLLQAVDGALTDVTCTEVTRQVGCIGINAVTAVGPDVAYMSDRNINLITLTDTNNSVQHKTLPLSRNIKRIFERVNWNYAYKVSLTFWDNKLWVALPLDSSTVCNTVLVYNFVTENWFGEWNFAAAIGMNIVGWATAPYLGIVKLHAVTEDGRVFVTDTGENDISGTTVSEISFSLTTRAYTFDNTNHYQRRLFLDMATLRPSFSITSYTDGVSESSQLVTSQTYARSESWIFNDSTYTLTNSNDDYNRQGRKDYSTGPDSVQCGTGFMPEVTQQIRFPVITRRAGRQSWMKVTNTTGRMEIMSGGFESRQGSRSNLVQVI